MLPFVDDLKLAYCHEIAQRASRAAGEREHICHATVVVLNRLQYFLVVLVDAVEAVIAHATRARWSLSLLVVVLLLFRGRAATAEFLDF